MRVLHIDTGRQMRGGQWQVLYLMRGLRDAGCECILLAPEDSALKRLAAGDGLDARPLSMRRVWKLARQTGIVHTHTGRAHALAAYAGARKLVVARRVAFKVKRGPVSRWKYSRAARFIAVSKYVEQILLDAGIARDKISVIYDGVPLLEVSRPGKRVIAPATDDPRKGSALVREAAKRAGIQVHFSGNLIEDLQDATLFVYISEQEGLGSGVLLAMSAGVPVVASRVGGLMEIVEHGVTGLLTQNDPEILAACIRSLLDESQSATEYGKRGRQRAAQHFSLERMVKETLGVYQEVLAC